MVHDKVTLIVTDVVDKRDDHVARIVPRIVPLPTQDSGRGLHSVATHCYHTTPKSKRRHRAFLGNVQ